MSAGIESNSRATQVPITEYPNSPSSKKSPGRRYGWTPLTGRGVYREIDKFLLHVDKDYQRKKINANRVADFAGDWSWPACGCILVVRRKDGTYWVYDGQHRLLAARKREDIQDMPCLVFEASQHREEARAFLDANTNRGPMRAFEKFDARLIAEEPNALRVAAVLEDIGYSVGGGSLRQVACIEAIERAFRRDSLAATTTLELCAQIYDGAPIRSDVFKGLCFLEIFMQKKGNLTILRPDIKSKLLKAGPELLLAKTREASAFYGKTGERAWAGGLANFINKGKRENQIPNPMSQ